MTLSMNNPTQNLEEAATIASEFIYSIDNLPNEVQFLLSEIRVKDTRAQEIQQEIDRESARYVQHALRPGTSGSAASLSSAFGSSPPSHSTTPSTATSAAPSSPTSASRSGSPRSAASPAGIAASYAEIQQLCDEKCALAQRLIELINRTRAKLDHDLARVRVLQGEPVDYVGASESLKNTLRASPSPASIDASTSGGPGSATKRRRLAPSASIKLSTPTRRRSSSPATTVSTTTHTHQRSRLSRQVLPPEESEEEAEADENAGDNTEDMEDVDAEDDDKIYCFCRKKSFGDMIACDNEGNCPYEWFHLSCVGLKQPPPETWYCSVCSTSMTKSTSGSTRKGRKK